MQTKFSSGYHIGLDEVGRGALAGPVVTGAVILPQNVEDLLFNTKIVIRDSKKMTSRQRKDASLWIYEHALATGIGKSSVKTINNEGIVRATNRAFRQSVRQSTRSFKEEIDYLAIDAFFIPQVAGFPKSRQCAIVHGDSRVLRISAASIIAKVYRDELMARLGQKNTYMPYIWQKNKGYGTREHCDAIIKYGTTLKHRTLFCRSLVS